MTPVDEPFAGKRLPKIGFGCGFRLDKTAEAWGATKPLIRRAVELGLTLLDTAEAYGDGLSEEIIGQAMGQASALIATKVSPQHLSRIELIGAAERSLKRLGLECIDLYQIHWTNPATPLEETAEGLSELTKAGKVRAIGICNASLRELRSFERALSPLRVSVVQGEYNLLDRSAEVELIPYCQASGKVFIAYSPLNQGTVPSRNGSADLFTGFAKRYGLSADQATLQWIVSKQLIPIPNTTKMSRLEAYAKALEMPLCENDLSTIDELFPFSPMPLPVEQIEVAKEGLWPGKIYRTVDEALRNPLNASPSPSDLARQFLAGDFLKPVRVRKLLEPRGPVQYELIEGRMRYWGWVIAFGKDKPIPVLVRE